MKTKALPLLLVGILTVALITVFHRGKPRVSTASAPGQEPDLSLPVETHSPKPQEPSASPNGFANYHWRPGERGCWQFGVSMRMASEPEKIAESSQTRLGGRLQLAVLSADAQQVTLAAAISDTWFDTDGRRVPRYEQLFNDTPAILTLSPSGNLLALAFPRQIPAEDRKLLCFAYGWEFVARKASSYQEQEYAPEGNASGLRATYRRADKIHISKTRHFPTASAPGEAMQNVVASEFTATIGKLWISGMSGWEDTLVSINGEPFAASRIAVSFKEETNSPAMAPALHSLLSNPASSSAFSKTPDPTASQTESVTRAVRREVLAARWGAVPFDQVFNSIQALAEGSMEQLTRPMKDLEDWLAVHPDVGPTKVLQSLQALPADQTTTSGLLINGLAEADTVQSREALSAILGAVEAFPPSTAIQAVVAVGDLGEKAPQPLKEALARLMDSSLSDGSYRMSDTALFSFARIAKEDAAAREYLLHRVAPWLEATAAPDQTVKALSALANAAANEPDLLERAAGFVRSPDAEIRLAAVDYLNSLPSTSPGRAILDQLGPDPDERVQAELERLRTAQQPAANP